MDYSSSIIIEKRNQRKRIQAVYASQLYGTFFGIFARIKSKDKGPKSKLIQKIEFKLLNYKGNVNLKITKDFLIDNWTSDNFNGIRIELPVKCDLKAAPIQKWVSLDFTKLKPHQDPNNIVETDGKGNKIGVKIRENQFLRIERKLMALNPNGSTIQDRTHLNGVFDSENYRRDGNFFEKVSEIDYDKAHKYESGMTLFPSASCVPSNNKVIFGK